MSKEAKPTVAACYPEVEGVDLVINATLSVVSNFSEYSNSFEAMKHVDFMTHPSGNILEIRRPPIAESPFGPIFVNEKFIFSEFVLAMRDGIPFHCADCADLFVQWFIEMQMIWGKKHHEDWYKAYRRGSDYSQRLN